MNFKEEYKKSAEAMNPSPEAMARMKSNIISAVNGTAPAKKKAIPFKKIAAVGGSVAACLVISAVAIRFLPSSSNSFTAAETAGGTAQDSYSSMADTAADFEYAQDNAALSSSAPTAGKDNTKDAAEGAAPNSANTTLSSSAEKGTIPNNTDSFIDKTDDIAENTACDEPIGDTNGLAPSQNGNSTMPDINESVNETTEIAYTVEIDDVFAEESAEIAVDDFTENTVGESEKVGDIFAYYDSSFKGFSSNTGSAIDYEDVLTMIKNGEKHGEILDSLYVVQTIKALTINECKKLKGWTMDYADRTIYEVTILEDLISGEAINKNAYIFISMGTVQYQDSGDPIYAPAEMFTVALAKPQEGVDFLKTPASYMFRWDVKNENGSYMVYARYNGVKTIGIPDAADIDKTIITSTTNNPAHYTQAVSIDKFADFFAADWEARSISSHFSE